LDARDVDALVPAPPPPPTTTKNRLPGSGDRSTVHGQTMDFVVSSAKDRPADFGQ